MQEKCKNPCGYQSHLKNVRKIEGSNGKAKGKTNIKATKNVNKWKNKT